MLRRVRTHNDCLVMMFWIAVAVLAAAVTFAVTRPLMMSASVADNAAAADIAVYKDQLAEIDADLVRGIVSKTDADNARAEVARRVLRAGETSAVTTVAANNFLKPVYIATTLALPLASVLLYLSYGAPGLPGMPLRERIAATVDANKPDELIAKVEARLQDHPEDGKGWDVIAPVYMAQRRFPDAATAYASAMKILGQSPTRLQGFADARIRAENGLVPDDARKALEQLVADDPKRKEPRIWLAMAKEQDGKMQEAAADYRTLIAEAPANAPWKAALQERLTLIEKSGGANGAGNVEKGPSAANIAAAEAMSPQDRAAMITGMVEGLAEKLKTNAKDKDGWLKLIRAYQMMGRKDDAIKAVAGARIGLAGDTAALVQIDDLVKQLGVGS
jgi:cytochrome c-type biogenesis protein CcmH